MRYLIYSHDTYGLGHLRRSLRVAGAVAAIDRRSQTLIVTGSPRASSFGLADGIDVVRLPAVTKDQDGRYTPRTLGGSIDEAVRLRASLIAAAVDEFRPHVMLVDHAPAGLRGELRPALAAATRPPRIVLGLRDIVDNAFRVAQDWDEHGIWDLIGSAYDEVVVYGDPAVCTTAQEVGVGERTGVRVTHAGYVACGRVRPASPADTEPHLLITAGGGGDGAPVVERLAEFLNEYRPAIDTTIVTGPLLSRRRRERIQATVTHLDRVTTTKFRPDVERLIAGASGVVAMGGYNTVAELLAAGTPAFLFPRRHPRMEQWIRAARLTPHADVRVGMAESVTDTELGAWLVHAMATEVKRPVALNLNGAVATAERLVELAASPVRPARLEGVSS